MSGAGATGPKGAGREADREEAAAGRYQCGRDEDGWTIIFSATFANIDRVCRRVAGFLREQGVASSFVVELGTREILNNAVVHGCGGDPNKTVRFRIFLRDGNLYLQSSDEGEGYQPRRPEPGEEGVLKGSGYGVAILHRYFDTVSFNASGNEITLVLKNFMSS
jgi:serine/threonine-protein kinase RsbW